VRPCGLPRRLSLIKNYGELFAGVQVLLSAVAVIGYGLARDWKHSLYWALAGGLTALVTWGFK